MSATRCDRLLVAAGGGGDALAAAIIHRMLCGDDHKPHIATYSWDRLMVDPVPGPRDPSWFEHTDRLGEHNVIVTEASTVRPPGNSLLPRLAGELATSFYLLDPRGGAVGMSVQLAELVDLLGVDQVSLVDVGGDIVARGDEPELRSPLADTLVLAAAHDIGAPVDVLVAGAGLDGELSADHVRQIITDLDGELTWRRLTPADVEPFRHVLDWHPSEATGLLIIAAQGFRGAVEIRDAGLPIDVTDAGNDTLRCAHARAFTHSRLARRLTTTATLSEAEYAAEAAGCRSEIRYERDKAARLSHVAASGLPASEWAEVLDDYCDRARGRGTTALTLRRAAEVLGVALDDLLLSELTTSDQLSARVHPPLLCIGVCQ